ncbi:RcnB family protein [Actimicrobium sp. CCI2.3]|uniref:RcnB family protein n=1 Tax=Actimicrobium sp. CCI2.3 TaxID=3048616 RepID=UPI002AB38F45|nr:RcnB family protein [Actimicrobium sp. CCI2.3]MDY7575601.1 RcnB family protein [Actimicrobium sp. CCI2.3]MEB0022028.1 RcnB family protein [Actimicrobium sp. CCI2.3]
MNKKALVSAILAMALGSSGLSFGQGRSDNDHGGDRGDRGRNEQAQRGGPPDRGDKGRGPDRRDDDRRDNDRGHDNRKEARYNDGRDGRGAGPGHNYRKGDRLPRDYRSRQYVVDDWRGHRLSAPPRGYHWVQTGGDYVLVAIASGIILQLFLGN